MLAYLVLSISVLAVLGFVMFLWPSRLPLKKNIKLLAILLVMTAIFDSIIISLNLVDYDYAKTLGVVVGRAPIEDFAYTIAAAVFIPYIWEKGRRHGKS